MSQSEVRRVWRRRLPLVTTIVLLTGALVAVPQLGNAASYKQFTATMNPTTGTGQVQGTWTETVTNCGGVSLQFPCTQPSAIDVGTIQIAVPVTPVNFQSTISHVTVARDNWTVSYANGVIQATAVAGVHKLAPGESVQITFDATPSTCSTGTDTFTTRAYGSVGGTSQAFTIVGSQPTINITGCSLSNGDTVTDTSTGESVTGDGITSGTVIVSFGGNLVCSSNQWSSYHMPAQVNIDGNGATGSPKRFTFTFPGTPGVDSSWYLVCIASTVQWPGGTLDLNTGLYVGILSSCYISASNSVVDPVASITPCVSVQKATLPDPSGNYSIVISVLDPLDTKFH